MAAGRADTEEWGGPGHGPVGPPPRCRRLRLSLQLTTRTWMRTVSRAVSTTGASWCPVGNRPHNLGSPEVPGGASRCQDPYQDWVALYCWAPFHATLMATPEGSRCRWEQIGRWVLRRLRAAPTEGLPPIHMGSCPPWIPSPHLFPQFSAAPTASSPPAPSSWPGCLPAPGPAPLSTPFSCRSTPNISATAAGRSPPGRGGRPPGWLPLWLWGWAASCPSQPPSPSAEPGEGLGARRGVAQPPVSQCLNWAESKPRGFNGGGEG